MMRGINENLAREILELHTLGVAAGYTQQDVREFAKMLTGWTFARRHEVNPGGFGCRCFILARHQQFSKLMLSPFGHNVCHSKFFHDTPSFMLFFLWPNLTAKTPSNFWPHQCHDTADHSIVV